QGTVCGIIDETDVLLAVSDEPEAFTRPVSDVMTRKLQTIDPEADVRDLLPIFTEDKVAIVVEHDQFLGLITKIDFITYMRKQLPS
ncbi:MAG: CBS domain-containing protein, partial [Phycisphaerales bacterium]|nr:CBS domain-containing protein [Phycisphaerales bacterium]